MDKYNLRKRARDLVDEKNVKNKKMVISDSSSDPSYESPDSDSMPPHMDPNSSPEEATSLGNLEVEASEGEVSDQSSHGSGSETSGSDDEGGDGENEGEDEDSFIVHSSEEYFGLDASIIGSFIKKKVKKIAPNLDDHLIDQAVDKALSKGADIIEEYSSAKPKDVRWKASLPKEKIEELEPLLEDARESIDHEEPTLGKILELMKDRKLSKEGGKYLIQLYDLYNNLEPYTYDYLSLRKKMVRKIKECERVEPMDFDALEEKEKQIMAKLPLNDLDSMKRRILELNTDDERKGRLLEIFYRLENTCSSSETYNTLKDKLTLALSLPYNKKSVLDDLSISSEPGKIASYLKEVRYIMDQELYGMNNVKEELLCFLVNRISNPNFKGSLGLEGMQGTGKCLGKNTPILMYNGSIKMVQDIRPDDLIMGDDSGPRKIMSTVTGLEDMYIIFQDNGDPYTVNESHILSLKNKRGDVIDVSVKNYIADPDKYKGYYGYKVCIEYPCQYIPYEPYVAGLCVGNGGFKGDDLEDYLINTSNVRLKFFEGIIKGVGGSIDKNGFSIQYQQRDDLTDVMVKLSRSLGIRVNVAKERGTTFIDGYVRGDLSHLLTKIQVYKKGYGQYFGFEIDGNKRFVLGDYTVTHNTSIVAALSKAIKKPFERIALGGMTDPTPLKGSDAHWVGSGPSIILSFLKNMKVSNGLILLDEIDKLGNTERGTIIEDALLHITDSTQNHEFTDSYLKEFTHDISNVWFIYAMNNKELINPILRDRLNIIEVEPYKRKDLKEIIKRYVLPKSLENVALDKDLVNIDDTGCLAVLDTFTSDIEQNGVRPVKKAIESIVSKINYLRMNSLPDGTILIEEKYGFDKFILPITIDRDVASKMMTKTKNNHMSYFI